MKLQKPTYEKEQKLYTSVIIDGFRLSSKRLGDCTYWPELGSFLQEVRNSLSEEVIQLTKGWFSKPIKMEWLQDRILLSIPTQDVKEDFEGEIVWQATSLHISKDVFLFSCEIVEQREDEKIILFGEEEEDTPVKLAEPEGEIDNEKTTRHILKEKVLKGRARAARALFHAERMTQQYCQLYGEDTDWEDDLDESD